MTKRLTAIMPYRDYGAFEVMNVLDAIRRTFSGVIICCDDLAWRDFNWFEEMHDESDGKKYGKAMKVAMRDAIHLGPRYEFRFESKSGEIIFGWAGRIWVGFQSEQDFSLESEQKIRIFLESLQLGQPEISAD